AVRAMDGGGLAVLVPVEGRGRARNPGYHGRRVDACEIDRGVAEAVGGSPRWRQARAVPVPVIGESDFATVRKGLHALPVGPVVLDRRRLAERIPDRAEPPGGVVAIVRSASSLLN